VTKNVYIRAIIWGLLAGVAAASFTEFARHLSYSAIGRSLVEIVILATYILVASFLVIRTETTYKKRVFIALLVYAAYWVAFAPTLQGIKLLQGDKTSVLYDCLRSVFGFHKVYLSIFFGQYSNLPSLMIMPVLVVAMFRTVFGTKPSPTVKTLGCGEHGAKPQELPEGHTIKIPAPAEDGEFIQIPEEQSVSISN
jgi:hypothetical protein